MYDQLIHSRIARDLVERRVVRKPPRSSDLPAASEAPWRRRVSRD